MYNKLVIRLLMLFSHLLFQSLGKHGHNFVQIAHNAEVGHTEDRCELILVDCNDVSGLLHAGQMLDCT